MEEIESKIRPSWYLDMKWIVALIFIPVFTLTMIVANLYIMTTRSNAVKVSGSIIEAMFTRGNESSNEDIENVREVIRKSPDKAFKPFPGTSIKITEEDLNKYSAKELKQNLFGQLAETIYDGSSAINPGGTFEENMSKLGLMAIFTKAGHGEIGKILLYAVLVSALLLAALIFFSYGFGRLISPGLIFILVGLPSLLFLTILQKQPASPATSGTEEMSIQQGVSSFVSKIGPAIAETCQKNYIILVVIGFVLILTGIIGRIIQKVRANSQTRAK